MPAPAVTLAQVARLDPCKERMNELRVVLPKRRRITAAEARAAGATLDDLVWVAATIAHTDKDVKRRLFLWSADCAAHVLHIYERTEKSDSPRKAIEAARAYARGEIGDDAGAPARTARNAARAAWAARNAARNAAWAARNAAWAAAWAIAGAAESAAAARAASATSATSAAWYAESAWQLDRLVARLSDPEPEDWPLSHANAETAA